jgi:hypothetical protein
VQAASKPGGADPLGEPQDALGAPEAIQRALAQQGVDDDPLVMPALDRRPERLDERLLVRRSRGRGGLHRLRQGRGVRQGPANHPCWMAAAR